jgi:hypothetical protein
MNIILLGAELWAIGQIVALCLTAIVITGYIIYGVYELGKYKRWWK